MLSLVARCFPSQAAQSATSLEILHKELQICLVRLLRRMEPHRTTKSNAQTVSTDHEHTKLLELLLQLPGCDPNAGLHNTRPGQPGWHPLLLALRKRREDVAELAHLLRTELAFAELLGE